MYDYSILFMHLKFVLEYVKYAKTTIDLVLPPDLVVFMCGFFSDMTRFQVDSVFLLVSFGHIESLLEFCQLSRSNKEGVRKTKG